MQTKNAPIIHIIRIIWIIIPMILTSCNAKSTEDLIEEDTFSDSTSAMEKLDITTTSLVDDILFLAPTPNDVMLLVNKRQIFFNESVLTPTSRVFSYDSFEVQLFNMGVFMTDMAYCNMFGEQAKTNEYIDAIEKLSIKINISKHLRDNIIARLRSNELNSDSLYTLAREYFDLIVNDLQKSYRSKTISYISAGAYTESLFLATHSIAKYNDNHPVLGIIAEQKYAFENLMFMLGNFRDDEGAKFIFEQMYIIKELFDSIELSEEYEESTASSSTTPVAARKSNAFVMDKSMFEAIKEQSSTIRNRYIL